MEGDLTLTERLDLALELGVVRVTEAELGDMIGLHIRHRYSARPELIGQFAVKAETEMECIRLVRDILPNRDARHG